MKLLFILLLSSIIIIPTAFAQTNDLVPEGYTLATTPDGQLQIEDGKTFLVKELENEFGGPLSLDDYLATLPTVPEIVNDELGDIELGDIEIGNFKDYSNIVNDDGTYTLNIHHPYFETEQGEFIEYRLTEDDDMVQIELGLGKFVFDKQNGAVTIFDDEGAIIIDSDSYIVKSATVNTDIWTNLEVNNNPVITEVVEDNGVVSVTFVRESAEGIFKTEYMLINGSLKTTAYFTNLSLENQKISFTETMQMVKDIAINNEVIDLDLYVGQTFPREVLELNQDLILEIKDLVYGAGIGFEQLWSVTVHEDRMVSLDYGKQSEDIVNIGDTVELDPSISYTSGSGWQYLSQPNTPTHNFTAITGATVTGWSVALVSTSSSYFIYGAHPTYLYVDLENPNTGVGDRCEDHTQDQSYSNYRYYTQMNCTGGASSGLSSALSTGSLKPGSDSYVRAGVTKYTSQNNYYMNQISGYWTWSITYTLPTAPSTPSAPSATTSSGSGVVNVSWSAPADNGSSITAYTLYRNGSSYQSLGNVTSYTDSSVSLGTAYNYSISATNGIGTSSTSSASGNVTPTTAPSTPSAPSATDNGNGTNRITWSAPSANGSSITSYTLYANGSSLGTQSSAYTHNSNVGTAYTYTVLATNSLGNSSQSSASNSVTTTDVPSTPSAPSASTNTGNGTNTISWSAPSANGKTITSYTLYANGSSLGTQSSGYTHSNPSLGTAYTYTVLATNANGNSSQSSASNSVTPMTVPSAPSAPTATMTSNTANSVAFSAPSANGSAIDDFRLYKNGSLVGSIGTSSPNANTGLSIGSTNSYQISAHNNVGWSALSSASNSILNANVPTAPTITGNAGVPIVINWSTPQSDVSITGYKIFRQGSLIATVGAVNTYSDNNSLNAGSTYSYTALAISAKGESAQSSAINVVAGVAPDPPTSISATISNTATAPLDVTVTWSSPTQVGTGTLSGFEIFRNGSSQGTVGLVNTFANTVPSSGAYSYTVKSISNHGTSVSSSADSITTPSAPSQPTLTVTVLNDTSMRLDWSASSENNSTLQGYLIQYSYDNSQWANLVTNTGNVALTRTATSLNVDDQYYWRISGINGVGSGTPSAVQNAWTQLSAPTNLVATAMSISQIDLAWTGINNISSYTIEFESPIGGGFSTLATGISNSATTYTSGSLTTGTQYNYRIVGISTASGSASVNSNTASANTFGILPAPVLDLLTSVTVNPASVQLDFTASSGLPLATGYKIERNLGSGWVAINTDTASTATTYLDSNTTAMNEPIYRVSAINTYGVSPPSNELTLTTIVAGGSGGGGSGGGSSQSTSDPAIIDSLLNLSILGNTHVMTNGEFITGKIPITWDSGDNLRISKINYDNSLLESIKFNIEVTTPIILKGSANQYSSDEITYTISTPNQICNALASDPSKRITTNCLQEKLYELPITITATSAGDNISQTTLITIDTRSEFGGETLALFSIFIMIVIAGIGIVKFARKSGKSGRNHSNNGQKKERNTSKKPRKSIK